MDAENMMLHLTHTREIHAQIISSPKTTQLQKTKENPRFQKMEEMRMTFSISETKYPTFQEEYSQETNGGMKSSYCTCTTLNMLDIVKHQT